MRVLKVLYTNPEASQLVANGVEGLDYELDENGQMVYPEGKSSMANLDGQLPLWHTGRM